MAIQTRRMATYLLPWDPTTSSHCFPQWPPPSHNHRTIHQSIDPQYPIDTRTHIFILPPRKESGRRDRRDSDRVQVQVWLSHGQRVQTAARVGGGSKRSEKASAAINCFYGGAFPHCLTDTHHKVSGQDVRGLSPKARVVWNRSPCA